MLEAPKFMEYLPLFINLKNRNCLVVGGGDVATRKIELLLTASAKITVIAKSNSVAIDEFSNSNQVTLKKREFRKDDVDSYYFVVACTNDKKVNQNIFRACEDKTILVNTVDNPELCTAIFPAIIDRSPVIVGISSGGRSPTLARIIKHWIEQRLPSRLGGVAEFIRERRGKVQDSISSIAGRQNFWSELLNGIFLEKLLRNKIESADDIFHRQLEVFEEEKILGEVFLIGAGPGDPELITLKGARLLNSADIVFYDNLIDQKMLELIRRDADKVYVGKKRKFPGIRQEAINKLLVENARAGKRVVRLKGGDPLIFGRAGEELEALSKENIPFEVIPGITAASGGASYAGIPLTHRDVSQSVRFITGHRVYDHVNLNWPELAKDNQTLVIYMGLAWIKEIMEQLARNGLDPKTPAAIIDKATMPEQKVVIGTIANLAQKAKSALINGPTIIIVGIVVDYRSEGSKDSSQA
ncbi:MAG: uroporphyrinogen-III C-methyltransferase [Gammaproteobacteria bacterium]|nr:uroporphyrinogen-III C-methyltransferase [Gammaproteobacteria bacterium]